VEAGDPRAKKEIKRAATAEKQIDIWPLDPLIRQVCREEQMKSLVHANDVGDARQLVLRTRTGTCPQSMERGALDTKQTASLVDRETPAIGNADKAVDS
jgi:hypothetical protein